MNRVTASFRIVSLSSAINSFQCRTVYSSKTGVTRAFLRWIQQPIDLSYTNMRRWALKKQLDQIVEENKFVQDRLDTLGPDLAAAHFIVARDGAIKFDNMDKWIHKNEKGEYRLPSTNVTYLKVEAIDMSNTNATYNSFDNLSNLEKLKYLNISRCKYIDDWCLDRLTQLRNTLLVLDVSGCPQITEKGIASLHRLRNLKRIIMSDMPSVRHFELTKTMLEEVMPGCVVEGNSSGRISDDGEDSPAFVKQYEQAMHYFNRHNAASELTDKDLDTSKKATQK